MGVYQPFTASKISQTAMHPLSPALLHLHSLSDNEEAVKKGRGELNNLHPREENRLSILYSLRKVTARKLQRWLSARALLKAGRQAWYRTQAVLGTIFLLFIYWKDNWAKGSNETVAGNPACAVCQGVSQILDFCTLFKSAVWSVLDPVEHVYFE